MQLSGQKNFKVNREAIWNLLMNPDTLAQIIPGISKLEKSAENSYKSILEIKIGPVSGSFEGIVELDEMVENTSFNLKARQNSKIGDANASIKIILTEVNQSETELAFNGDVKLTGLLASMGQRMVSGVANTLIKQFFANMEKELQKQFAS